MKIRNKKSRRKAFSVGSALILAVVLTSLLAIIGVLFLMASRVNKIAASAISQTRELDLAVDAVVAQIAEQLALDVPRVDPTTGEKLQEYYDYPDEENQWLASLELFEDPPDSGTYKWRHLSDVYDNLDEQYIRNIVPRILPEYQNFGLGGVGDSSQGPPTYPADADGDGVYDSLWIELPDITSSKGWPIYAAIRVIDNGGMLNVNTAYKFDPTEVPLLPDRIDGSSQTQINLAALSQRGVTNGTLAEAADVLHAERCYGQLPALSLYQQNVVWRYNEPNGLYTPFDISDELKLRNRYILNYNRITTRVERLWTRAYDGGIDMPRTDQDLLDSDPDYWFFRAVNESPDPCIYDYRHISTTYNMDRIIAPDGGIMLPDGGVMLNINTADKYALRDRIRTALLDADPGYANVGAAAAQIAANLIDFRDEDEIVTAVVDDTVVPVPPAPPPAYYGFERPCVYISELVHKYVFNPLLDITGRSYAIELYKPYFEDNDPAPGDWQLVIDNGDPCTITWSGTRRFHVIKWEDPNALLPVSFMDPSGPNPPDEADWVDPNIVLRWPGSTRAVTYNVYLGSGVNDVNLIGSDVNVPTYDPNGLEPETVYFWRVDDVNGPSTWEGEVWWFTTGPADYNYSESPQFYSRSFSDPNVFNGGSIIELRRVAENGVPVVVDSVQVPGSWKGTAVQTDSFQRDNTLHKCIRRLWDFGVNTATLGYTNGFRDLTEPNIMIQAHPYLDPDIYGNRGFKNIGEIGMVFSKPAYYEVGDDPALLRVIGYSGALDTEEQVRIDLANPDYQQIFNYLTVFDPVIDYIDNDGDGFGIDTDGNNILDPCEIDPDELKIPGRININTAPWYVIAQLPWMTPEIAQAIAYYRRTWQGPFRSIGQLSDVNDIAPFSGPNFSIYYYARADGPYVGDQIGFPDLTPADGAADDLEERDLLFARISNLVTVRSDVFTAYILVRIGPDGPQKRVMAILDRSDVNADGSGGVTGRVRIRALHPVPDPR